MPDYELKFSARRTLALEVSRDARLIVRAPRGMRRADIEQFVAAHADWIAEKLRAAKARTAAFDALTDAEVAVLKARAAAELIPLTERYAAQMGLSPRRVRITSAKSRFGSCGRDGNICYSWRLMLYPAAAREYVVVHELCHMRHFDHSRAFYALLGSVLPDYRARRALLKAPGETDTDNR